jgi:hypothetical protein
MKAICFYRFAIISQLRRCYFGINFIAVILDFYEWKHFGITQTNMSTYLQCKRGLEFVIF